jgi:phospholipase D
LIYVSLITFLVGSGLGYIFVNPSQYEERIADLESEIADLNIQISALQSEKSFLESRILQLEQQLEIEVLGVYFSPKGGCEDQIIYWISRANVSLHILIYSFTLDSIGDALVEAHNQGLAVRVVLEKSQVSQYSEYQKLKAAGIMVRNDTNSKLMHNKVMIIDGVIVITGSFNWSQNAEERNNENLIVINSTYVAAVYEEEFAKIWSESQP